MSHYVRFVATCGILAFGGLLAPAPLGSQSARESAKAQPPHFADPDRRAKLVSALPEIDRLFSEFAERSRVPGIAYGIIVDGELVKIGTAGYRDIAAKAPVTSDTVFRIASMTKSFTAMAMLKLRDEGKLSLDEPAERYVPGAGRAHLSHDRLAASHDPPPALPLRGLSRGQPLGRPAAGGDRRRDVGDDPPRHPLLECAGAGLRVLQLRVRDSRPHRLTSVRRAVP